MVSAIDLFSGCGGATAGLKMAGFRVIAAVEMDKRACETYKLNHPDVNLICRDIRALSDAEVAILSEPGKLDLLIGCPPCQGFSSIRRLNRNSEVFDERNDLINEFARFARILKPRAVMLENVPALERYTRFQAMMLELDSMGYNPDYRIDQIQFFGVPQRRKRLIMLGALSGKVEFPGPSQKYVTVRDTIGELPSVDSTNDVLHKRYPRHTPAVMRRIELTPKNGGGRKDVPELELDCHRKSNVGFNDVYGRMTWDKPASTITGGCLNPSKGRFLHPEEDRCITAREAALLQTFPSHYRFPNDASLSSLALQIGNAVPPEYIRIQANNLLKYI